MLEVTVEYRSHRACFKIHQEREGIFTARLLSFEGEASLRPTKEITLVRGVRKWTGSIDDEALLDELGEFIDTKWQ